MKIDSKYYLLIDNETRWMCRIVSPFSDSGELKTDGFINDINPHLLLEKIKRHRLYPVFYKKWKEWENRPEGPKWDQFEISLKKLVEKNQLRMMQKTAALVELIKEFDKTGIRVIAMKGPVLAQQLYGNIAMKASIDLDILISENDFDKAVYCLQASNFICKEMENGFSPRQKKYLLKNFHHLGMIHQTDKIQVELHWMLNTNRYLIPYSLEMLYNSSVIKNIAGIEVRVMNPLYQSIHLMVHGSFHQWARLDWLLDWSVLKKEQIKEEGRFKEEVRRLGLSAIAIQSAFLEKIYFEEKDLKFPSGNEGKLVKISIQAGRKEYEALTEEKLRQKLYLLRLKPGLKYKLQVITALGTNKEDWAMIKFPDRFFYMYYIVRPVLYFYQKFNRKK